MTLIRLLLILLSVMLLSLPALAADEKPAAEPTAEAGDEAKSEDDSEAEEEEEDKGPFKPFDEVTKDTELQEGFFDMYTKSGSLLLTIKPDQLDMPFLMTFEVSQGIGAGGLNGGTMLNIFEGKIMVLERHDDKIFLVQRSASFRAEGEDAWAEVMDLSFGDSVVKTAAIESQREDDEALLINVHGWFVSNISGIENFVKAVVSTTPGQPGQASFDGERSYLNSVKVFEQNIGIDVRLTFATGAQHQLNTLADPTSIPVGIHATLAALPDKPMEPREGDDRMGYFMTVHKDYTRTEDGFFTRYLNRWRLEKGKKSGDLYRPKKQIVYYIDHSVPKRYRPWIEKGIEAWNKAYEAAGFKDAIKAEMLPDDADAEDLRYATIRWMATDVNGYLAIGPSVVDPRTGEVLDADILIDASFIQNTTGSWRQMADPARGIEQHFLEMAQQPDEINIRAESPSFQSRLGAEAMLAHSALVAAGKLSPGEPMPEEYMGEFLTWVVMHEVGHSLGLRHNFRSSTDTPMSELHNKEWSEANGLVSSCMDYAAANLAAAGQPNGQFFSSVVGTADEWVIGYGYHHDDDVSDALAREGAAVGHAYATDEDRAGPGAMDPTVNAWDLGSDPLEWSIDRTELIESIWPNLAEYVLVDNASRLDLRNYAGFLIGSYLNSLTPAVKSIGGQYVYRDHVGDPGERPPFVPVSRDQQEKALNHLMKCLFIESAFDLPDDVVQGMGANRWSHWGNTNNTGGRIDFPWQEQIAGIQNAFLNTLTSGFRLAKMSDAELKFGRDKTLGLDELLVAINSSVFSEIESGKARNIYATRRNLQRVWVDRMITLMTKPPAHTPSDAVAVTRLIAHKLQRKIEDNLGRNHSALDMYSLAHLTQLNERLESALAGGLELEMMAK